MHTSGGYIAIKVPWNHHLRQKHGYAYEHQLIAERMLGRRLRRGETVHHGNEIRHDNRESNLEVLMKPAHARLHSRMRLRDRLGRFKS